MFGLTVNFDDLTTSFAVFSFLAALLSPFAPVDALFGSSSVISMQVFPCEIIFPLLFNLDLSRDAPFGTKPEASPLPCAFLALRRS